MTTFEERINFYSEDFKLEGNLSYRMDGKEDTETRNSQDNPQSPISNPQSVLLCSPHPGLGGDMDNNVILSLAESLAKIGFITLRFNYRGVGNSESRFADFAQKFEYWENSMETDEYGDFVMDVKYALSFLKNETKTGEDHIFYMIGYSFGAIQTMKVGLQDKDVKGIVCISTPFGKYDMKFAEISNKPKYFMSSDNDFAASLDDVEQGFKKFSDPKSLTMITDCDHFYRGKEDFISEKVINFLVNC
ncbi:MAG: alpha/beta hydrolase [Candidatus Anammoxibacter sp.]